MSGAEMALVVGGVQALSAISQGRQQSKIAKYNAKVAENDAIAARQASDYEESRFREQTRRLISSQRAAAGASGASLEGSPLLVMLDTIEEAELDALAIRHSGTVEAARGESRAALERLKGRQARQSAWIGAGAALLQGGAKYHGAREKKDASTPKKATYYRPGTMYEGL